MTETAATTEAEPQALPGDVGHETVRALRPAALEARAADERRGAAADRLAHGRGGPRALAGALGALALAQEVFVIEHEGDKGSDGDSNSPGRERMPHQSQPYREEKRCGDDKSKNGNLPGPFVKPPHFDASQFDP